MGKIPAPKAAPAKKSSGKGGNIANFGGKSAKPFGKTAAAKITVKARAPGGMAKMDVVSADEDHLANQVTGKRGHISYK